MLALQLMLILNIGETLDNVYINLSSSNNLFFYFLNDHIGLVGESVESNITNNWLIYYETYYKNYADALANAIESLHKKIIDKLFNSDDVKKLKNEFTFEITKSGNGNVLFLDPDDSSGDLFQSIKFENNLNETGSGYGYLKLKDDSVANDYLSKLLFKKNDYNSLMQQFDITEIPPSSDLTSSLFDSKKDATMVFWTKISGSFNDNGLFSFSNDSSNETFYFEVEKAGFISKTNFTQQIEFRIDQLKDLDNNWIMWSIKFDNHNENKLGLHVTAYGYDKNNLSICELNNSIFSISNPNNNLDYIVRMTDDFFNNSLFSFRL